MCRFKSGIILRNKIVLTPIYNESHSRLLETLGIEDDRINAMKTFVRVELIPKNNDKTTDVDEWRYNVDQDILPDWYEKDPERYEKEFRDAVREYVNRQFMIACGYTWISIKEDEYGTYYLLDGIINNSEFGETNNYANSYIRKNLNESDLAEKLKEKFGDRIVPIKTNLLSLDGLDDYGEIDGDMLAIPTLDLYRECRKRISDVNSSWWLATSDSTPSGYGSCYVRCVRSDGYVGCNGCGYGRGVRPFFILQS